MPPLLRVTCVQTAHMQTNIGPPKGLSMRMAYIYTTKQLYKSVQEHVYNGGICFSCLLATTEWCSRYIQRLSKCLVLCRADKWDIWTQISAQINFSEVLTTFSILPIIHWKAIFTVISQNLATLQNTELILQLLYVPTYPQPIKALSPVHTQVPVHEKSGLDLKTFEE